MKRRPKDPAKWARATQNKINAYLPRDKRPNSRNPRPSRTLARLRHLTCACMIQRNRRPFT